MAPSEYIVRVTFLEPISPEEMVETYELGKHNLWAEQFVQTRRGVTVMEIRGFRNRESLAKDVAKYLRNQPEVHGTTVTTRLVTTRGG